MTFKHFLIEQGFLYNGISDRLNEAIEQYATLQWNAAIEAAAKSAELRKAYKVNANVIDKHSILKLKK